MSKIKHSGFMSSIRYDNLKAWHITSVANEVIKFKYENNNALLIEAHKEDLFVRILPSDYCLLIPAGEGRTVDLQRVGSIQIMGEPEQEIRWSGQFF